MFVKTLWRGDDGKKEPGNKKLIEKAFESKGVGYTDKVRYFVDKLLNSETEITSMTKSELAEKGWSKEFDLEEVIKMSLEKAGIRLTTFEEEYPTAADFMKKIVEKDDKAVENANRLKLYPQLLIEGDERVKNFAEAFIKYFYDNKSPTRSYLDEAGTYSLDLILIMEWINKNGNSEDLINVLDRFKEKAIAYGSYPQAYAAVKYALVKAGITSLSDLFEKRYPTADKFIGAIEKKDPEAIENAKRIGFYYNGWDNNKVKQIEQFIIKEGYKSGGKSFFDRYEHDPDFMKTMSTHITKNWQIDQRELKKYKEEILKEALPGLVELLKSLEVLAKSVSERYETVEKFIKAMERESYSYSYAREVVAGYMHMRNDPQSVFQDKIYEGLKIDWEGRKDKIKKFKKEVIEYLYDSKLIDKVIPIETRFAKAGGKVNTAEDSPVGLEFFLVEVGAVIEGIFDPRGLPVKIDWENLKEPFSTKMKEILDKLGVKYNIRK